MADDVVCEDVLFENSALYAYLKEVGYREEDIESTSLEDVQQPPRDNSSLPKDDGKFEHMQTFKTLAKHFIHICAAVEDFRSSMDGVRQRHVRSLTACVIDSRLVEEEDSAILSNWFTSKKSCNADSLSKVGFCSFEKSFTIRLSLLVAFLALGLYHHLDVDENSIVWNLLIGIACFVCIGPYLVKFAMILHKDWLFNTKMKYLERFIQSASVVTSTMKKCTRLIQEKELVARGFTLVLPDAPLARLENSRLQHAQRQCPNLRHCLFLTCRKLLIYFKAETSKMDTVFPLDADISESATFLSHIPLDEYGPCLTEIDEDILRDITNDFSVSNLKKMVELFRIHLSEYLKRLVLSCHCDCSLPAVLQSTSGPQSELEARSEVLMQLYQLHKFQPQTKSEEYMSASLVDCKLTNIYTAVHSLNLHLQASLFKVQTLEQEIESLVSGPEGLSPILEEKFSVDLKAVKADLDACCDCFEEGVNKLESSSDQLVLPGDPVSLMPVPSDQKPVVSIGADEPIIQDQVFEAYVAEVQRTSESSGTEWLLSDEEREKKRRKKQEAARVLTELRSVIAVRAADWDERERKARQRMNIDTSENPEHLKSAENLLIAPQEKHIVPEPLVENFNSVTGSENGNSTHIMKRGGPLAVSVDVCNNSSRIENESPSSQDLTDSMDSSDIKIVKGSDYEDCPQQNMDDRVEIIVKDPNISVPMDQNQLCNPPQSLETYHVSESDMAILTNSNDVSCKHESTSQLLTEIVQPSLESHVDGKIPLSLHETKLGEYSPITCDENTEEHMRDLGGDHGDTEIIQPTLESLGDSKMSLSLNETSLGEYSLTTTDENTREYVQDCEGDNPDIVVISQIESHSMGPTVSAEVRDNPKSVAFNSSPIGVVEHSGSDLHSSDSLSEEDETTPKNSFAAMRADLAARQAASIQCGFGSSIAAMAAARSQMFGGLKEDTFGGSDSD